MNSDRITSIGCTVVATFAGAVALCSIFKGSLWIDLIVGVIVGSFFGYRNYKEGAPVKALLRTFSARIILTLLVGIAATLAVFLAWALYYLWPIVVGIFIIVVATLTLDYLLMFFDGHPDFWQNIWNWIWINAWGDNK